MTTGALYIIDFPNGKAYVGITAGNAEERFSEHRYHAETHRGRYAIHRALRKYPDATMRTIAVANDWQYLCTIEKRAIAAYGTFGKRGYNMTAGGEGALGYKHTPESLKRMGAVHKGKAHHTTPHSAETRAKMSRDRLGKKLNLTPEQHAKRIEQLNVARSRVRAVVYTPEMRREKAAAVMKAGVGVSWCKATKKWRAHISVDRKMRCLGRYVDRAEAERVRANAVACELERLAAQ